MAIYSETTEIIIEYRQNKTNIKLLFSSKSTRIKKKTTTKQTGIWASQDLLNVPNGVWTLVEDKAKTCCNVMEMHTK